MGPANPEGARFHLRMQVVEDDRAARLHAKADELLKRGDALEKTNPAESRRLLRERKRYRRMARKAAR